MTNLETYIFRTLAGATRQRPVLLRHLETMSGVGGRKIRDCIANMQSAGVEIVSLGKGYWLGTPDEVSAYWRREKKRAITILKKLKHLLPKSGELVNQLELSL